MDWILDSGMFPIPIPKTDSKFGSAGKNCMVEITGRSLSSNGKSSHEKRLFVSTYPRFCYLRPGHLQKSSEMPYDSGIKGDLQVL